MTLVLARKIADQANKALQEDRTDGYREMMRGHAALSAAKIDAEVLWEKSTPDKIVLKFAFGKHVTILPSFSEYGVILKDASKLVEFALMTLA